MTAPTTPKKVSPDGKPTKSPFVLGKGPEPINNASIKAKIQKWQAAGGGAVVVEDAVAAAPGEVASPKPKDEKKDSPARAPDVADGGEKPKANHATPEPPATPSPRKKAQINVAKPKANGLDKEVQEAVTPKKRVVSDGRWRKDRSPAKEPQSKPNAWVRTARKPSLKEEEKPPEPKKSAVRKFVPQPVYGPDGTRVLAVRRRRKSSASKSSEEEVFEEEMPYEPPSSGDRVREAIRRHEERNALDDPVEVIVKKRTVRRSRRDLEDKELPRPNYSPESPAVRGARSEDELRRRRKARRRREPGEQLSSPPPQDDSDRRRSRRVSHRSRDSSPGPQGGETPTSTKDAPPHSNPETPTGVFGTRVEAWLSGTPDPFGEGKENGEEQKRRRRSGRHSSSSTEESVLHADDRHDDIDHGQDGEPSPRHGTVRRRRPRRTLDGQDDQSADEAPRRHRPPNIDAENLITVEYDSSAPSSPASPLKRRGATRGSESPIRSRSSTLPATIPENEVVSSVDSSVDTIDHSEAFAEPLGRVPSKREFPTTGRKLSTIVSVETPDPKGARRAVSRHSDDTVGPDDVTSKGPSLSRRPTDSVSTVTGRTRPSNRSRRRLVSHADVISVLSMPEEEQNRSRTIVSARSIRTSRSRLATATMDDLMRELRSDESKYMRELRTLVDGVIPVLLTCVLSKSDAAVAAGLFSKGKKDDPHITKPIVDMGIALERLKSLHKRIPKERSESLLMWAQSAHKVYGDYVKSWRLGFQDVVVNLAPASDKENTRFPRDAESEMARNEDGYVVNGDGERVDVAFLLKRPLVRLKYLAKTFKGINILKPSDRASEMATKYQILVEDARKRSYEERARLEDESAANIDPTRARDPRSLAPLTGVCIDHSRCVRARDYFDMTLLHSSGQEVDCKVELLLRDDAPGRGISGDLLICEVDSTGRWLFFPPILKSRLSARNGDHQGEIVVMVRGSKSGGDEWQELLTLRTDVEEVGFEWVQMLGLTPIPPKVTRAKSFKEEKARPPSSLGSSRLTVETGSTLLLSSRTPSPREIHIPIGEQASETASRWTVETPERQRTHSSETTPSTPPSSGSNKLKGMPKADELSSNGAAGEDLTPRQTRSQPPGSAATAFTDAMVRAESPTAPALKRSKAQRFPKDDPRTRRGSRDSSVQESLPATSGRTSRAQLDYDFSVTDTSSYLTQSTQSTQSTTSVETNKGGGYSVWYPPSGTDDDSYSDGSEEEEHIPLAAKILKPFSRSRRTSSVPTSDMPTVNRLRKPSPAQAPAQSDPQPEAAPTEKESTSPNKLQKKRFTLPFTKDSSEKGPDDVPPPPPPHRVVSPAPLRTGATPNLSPTTAHKGHRRTSSPLKHEYHPSTCSDSSGDSDLSYSDEDSIFSESSEDELEAADVLGSLPGTPMEPFKRQSPPESLYTSPNDTLTPSQSASQAPYRTVPSTSTRPLKSVATLMAWSDKGMWTALHPEECSIVVTPGLIEAYEMSAAHSKDTPDREAVQAAAGTQPLVALELTPLVPLSRGTALDISIRSPPTANSKLKVGANIMFRSRSQEECELLYGYINSARINNPTYIALQNARGPSARPDTWGALMDRRNDERTEGSIMGGGSWWGSLARRGTYRAKSTRAISTSAGTTSSVNTIGSAFSALKRFSTGKGLFNIAKSSIHSSGDGSRSRSTDSLTMECESSTGASPSKPVSPTDPFGNGLPVGITNPKIRLYSRESNSRWRDMGKARLSIMRPSRPSTPSQNVRNGQGGPGLRDPENEMRIMVLGKTKGETLLDVTLGESCFERVGRLGIAVSVWEDTVGTHGDLGGVPAVGGVAGARARIYMIQMKTERDCAYCFSLLGKLRY
ncbi:uncharacterized protein IWZ02DRAFT_489068 [Phyllosticta citriasiana]|uniref:uncharacterized protein n=1 Tax=Phyllosticta citriasiana TaxID=595635 RepID=UPI0030FD75E1